MSITISQIIILIMLSGLSSVDRLAGFNIMLSRPFVVAGLVGYTLDNLIICLIVGILFELVGMLEIPVGTTVVKDDTFGGYCGSILVGMGISVDGMSMLLSLSITMLAVYPVTLTDKYYRKFNNYLIRKHIKKGDEDFERKLIYIGLLTAFVRGIIVYNVALIIIVYIVSEFKSINTSYFPSIFSLILLSIFMSGYLLRFFAVNKLWKISLFLSGLLVGWLVI